MNTPESPPLMQCDEIKHGMIFKLGEQVAWRNALTDPDALKTWTVLSVDERGPRRNRFFCSPVGDPLRIVLFCFDCVFEKETYNFRFPNEAP